MKHSFPYLLAAAILYTCGLIALNGFILANAKEITEKLKPAREILAVSQTPQATHMPKKSIKFPILMYHYVRTVTDKKDKIGIGLSVPPEMFDKQMKLLLDKGFTTVTLDDLANAWNSNTPLPKKPIIITFDDGYDDLYKTAYPILKKYNIKATAYIVPGFIDTPRYLTSKQLKELSDSLLVTIASHTMKHVSMNNASRKRMREEITNSKTWLEKFTGQKIKHFSYPSGQYNKTAMKEAELAGYLTATTTQPGTIHHHKERFATKRVRIPGTITLADFEKLIHQ